MAQIWLTDIETLLRPFIGRGITGVRTIAGWETRARSSGGLIEVRGAIWHHTASGPRSDGANDANFIATGGGTPPISQLYLDRTGTVWIIAAGAANHAGRGGPLAPRSPAPWLPQNDANRYTIGIEMANAGTGEQWPRVQLEAAITLGAILTRRFRYSLDRNIGHRDWCGPDTSTPGRKIDPSGPWQNGPRWPSSSSWGPFGTPLRLFQVLIARRIEEIELEENPPEPPPPPPPPPPSPITAGIFTIALPGESYWTIARRTYGEATTTIVAALQEANDHKPLRSGDQVVLAGKVVLS
jgi:hypothetical protein